MSKFTKQKSFKLLNHTPNINIKAVQLNSDVIALNKVYEVTEQNSLTDEISNTIMLHSDPVVLDISNSSQRDIQNLCLESIYPAKDKIQESNPLNNKVSIQKIQYGNTLDYLYKKNQLKK